MSMSTAPVTSVQMVQRSLSEQVPTMIYTTPTHQVRLFPHRWITSIPYCLFDRMNTTSFLLTINRPCHRRFPTKYHTNRSTLSNQKINRQVNWLSQESQLTFILCLDSTLASLHSSSSPSSSFLTPIPPSTTDPSFTSMEHQSMTSSPAHENENLPFEACRTSPTLTREHESTPTEPTIHLTASDPLEQWPLPLIFFLSLCSSAIYVLVSSHSEQQLVVYKFVFVSLFPLSSTSSLPPFSRSFS